MKYLFASDLHGSAPCVQKLKETFLKEKADFLVLCGDLLYHGPRNDLPDGYRPKEVIEILNSLSNKIVAVRGNCDTEVDQMVLDFPMLCDYSLVTDNGVRMYVTHGHQTTPLKLSNGDIMISGHTHILTISNKDDITYINPGSISIPKENNPKSYMIYENRKFTIKDFNGNVIKDLKI